ncbi:ProQ/FINO family protein, partial [Ideonella sp.]|uniref:ProQ/FINO family protein n=1 Tax=Ideonella sp. TaxID=1929293 RepID=UPI003BB59A01
MSSTPLPSDPTPELLPTSEPLSPNADAQAIADAPAPISEAETEAAAPTDASDVAAPAAAPMTPAECAQQLKQRFPGLFAGGAKPLKLRVQADIQARAPGVFTKQALSAFLRRHTGSTSYLIALSRASHRFDLDGAQADALSDEHRQAALDELARRRSLNEDRRAEEEQQRRNRATLLRDFEHTTLTEANFCALKGVSAEELPGLLAIAREEAAAQPAPRPGRP